MIGVAVSIASDTARPALRRLIAGVQPARVAPVIGRAGRNVVREHLFGRDTQGNRLGGRRTHYYGAAARGTQFTYDGASSVVISTNQIGIRQRFYGGTITPKNSKYLTIPVHPSAHGKRAREFSDLEVVFGAGGKPVALARKAKGKRQFGEIYYLLLKSVSQRADPTVIPTEEALTTAVTTELGKYLDLLNSRASGPAPTQ